MQDAVSWSIPAAAIHLLRADGRSDTWLQDWIQLGVVNSVLQPCEEVPGREQ